MPPPNTTTSSAPRASSAVEHRREVRHVRPRHDRQPDRVDRLLRGRRRDHLGRLVQPAVDDLVAGVGQRRAPRPWRRGRARRARPWRPGCAASAAFGCRCHACHAENSITETRRPDGAGDPARLWLPPDRVQPRGVPRRCATAVAADFSWSGASRWRSPSRPPLAGCSSTSLSAAEVRVPVLLGPVPCIGCGAEARLPAPMPVAHVAGRDAFYAFFFLCRAAASGSRTTPSSGSPPIASSPGRRASTTFSSRMSAPTPGRSRCRSWSTSTTSSSRPTPPKSSSPERRVRRPDDPRAPAARRVRRLGLRRRARQRDGGPRALPAVVLAGRARRQRAPLRRAHVGEGRLARRPSRRRPASSTRR